MTNINHMSEVERKAYRDAYRIVYPGASNASGVALAIHETICALRNDASVVIDNPARHDAVRAMVGQLAYLVGESLGSDVDGSAYTRVKAVYDALERDSEIPVGTDFAEY